MDFSFCPVLDDLLKTQRAVGASGKTFEGLGALSTVNNLAVLRSLMLERRPEFTLEVGFSYGGSALAIAATHRDLGRAGSRQHTVIDPYQVDGWDSAGLAAIGRAGLGAFVDFRSEPSALALPALLRQERRYGLIYIDGSHFFDDVFVDAYYGFRLLADDGVMLFDDCTTDHVAKVVKFITTNWDNWTSEVDLSGHRPGGATLKYRVARKLNRIQLRAFRRRGADTRRWDAPLQPF